MFLTADPISPLGGSSPRLHRYAYVGYDPVNFTDPTGLFLEDVWNAVTDFASLYIGVIYVAPVNLLTTGRLQTSGTRRQLPDSSQL